MKFKIKMDPAGLRQIQRAVEQTVKQDLDPKVQKVIDEVNDDMAGGDLNEILKALKAGLRRELGSDVRLDDTALLKVARKIANAKDEA